MHRNRHGSGVSVLNHHVVAALDPIQAKAKIPQRSNRLFAIHSGEARHPGLANSHEVLQLDQSLGAERNLLMVGFHGLDVAPDHLRCMIQSFELAPAIRGHAMKFLDVSHESIALLVKLHIDGNQLRCGKRMGLVGVRIRSPLGWSMEVRLQRMVGR